MKLTCSLSDYLFFIVSISIGAASILAVTTATASANADDWKLVSAPPPPGPYQAVNLDTRIPVQAGVPSFESAPRFQPPFGNAAPTTSVVTSPASDQGTNKPSRYQFPPQVPGNYPSMMPRPPVNAYPGYMQYPGYAGRQNYGRMTPRGYFPAQPFQGEELVPPPPVYDAMMQAPPGAYQGSAGR